MRRVWMNRWAALAVGVLVAEVAIAAPPALKTKEEMTAYAVGVETARNFKKLGVDVNPDLVAQGMKDAMAGGKLLMTDADLDGVVTDFRAELLHRARTEKQTLAMDNQKISAEFLAENKTKEGVVTLQSGLQFKVLAPGAGKPPTEADTVECHYRGTLIDGTEFDDTRAAGHPATIKLSDLRVIAGLREALKLMPVGAKWQLFIPPRLAYLNVGRAPHIGPNQTLIFEIEVLTIK